MQSRDWPPIERLPERPGIAVMTSGGYWRDGVFYPTHRVTPRHDEPPRRGFLDRVLGR